MSYQNKKIVIIGGGPAGVSAAKFALNCGFSHVTILEASKTLGGLHKDVEISGLHYDLGAFFFWEDHNLLTLFPEIKEKLVYAESTRHFSLTKHLNLDKYPLTLKLYLKENGLTDFFADIVRLLYYRLNHRRSSSNNVEELMTYYMGPFYSKSGLKNYIRRLYNMEPQDVAIEFAAKRIATVIDKFRFSNILRALIRLNWRYLTSYEIKKDSWARPESGFGTMYTHIQEDLIKNECTILLSNKVTKIDPATKIIETITGKIIEYDYLLSTQSIEATGLMAGIPFNGVLNYRVLCSLFYEIPSEPIEDCFVLFNFSNTGKWKRVTFHSHYYNRTHKDNHNLSHYFVVESMPDDSQLENINMVELLSQDFLRSFVDTKWYNIFTKSKLVGHHILKNAYPVLDIKFKRSEVLAFKEEIKKKDILLVGRQGEFDYISSSDSSANAVEAVKEILKLILMKNKKRLPEGKSF